MADHSSSIVLQPFQIPTFCTDFRLEPSTMVLSTCPHYEHYIQSNGFEFYDLMLENFTGPKKRSQEVRIGPRYDSILGARMSYSFHCGIVDMLMLRVRLYRQTSFRLPAMRVLRVPPESYRPAHDAVWSSVGYVRRETIRRNEANNF